MSSSMAGCQIDVGRDEPIRRGSRRSDVGALFKGRIGKHNCDLREEEWREGPSLAAFQQFLNIALAQFVLCFQDVWIKRVPKRVDHGTRHHPLPFERRVHCQIRNGNSQEIT